MLMWLTYWLWRLFGVRPRIRAVCVVTGDDGQWIMRKCAGLCFSGGELYENGESLRKHNPQYARLFKEADQC